MAGLRLGNLELRLLKSIFASEEIKYALENMPDFLPPDTDRNQTEALKIVLHNTEGLLILKKDIENSRLFTYAHVACFTETWLKKDDYENKILHWISQDQYPECSVQGNLIKR